MILDVLDTNDDTWMIPDTMITKKYCLIRFAINLIVQCIIELIAKVR